jgi:hypothetical protein
LKEIAREQNRKLADLLSIDSERTLAIDHYTYFNASGNDADTDNFRPPDEPGPGVFILDARATLISASIKKRRPRRGLIIGRSSQ